ncbi:ABC transporter permease subunit [Metabacillus sp. KIGAM252]|uniref:ABC transporter permease subunit n=1 Tax=Metabacillus flavus TaxID=2823519 RepID=A0ABS5LAN5_9BACI|nr:ABC transporter permease subunit [Metabacillus flavus]MBS2967775.1 ABC transporter permease subunit [Metabacillus flavus]
MDKTVIAAIFKKDITQLIRTKNLFITLIVIPLIFSTVFPIVMSCFVLFADVGSMMDPAMLQLIDKMLVGLQAGVMPELNQKFFYIFTNYLYPSLFLLIPIITSSVIAANSFAGEKERRTLESLLFSPITIKELFAGKVLASFIPSVAVSLISFIISGIIINVTGFLLFEKLIFPSGKWLVLILCLSPLVMIMTILLNVIISAKVKTYQEAQNIGGIIVLPVIGMLVGQLSGLFLLGIELMLMISAAVLLLNVFLFYWIMKFNNRNSLFENQIG